MNEILRIENLSKSFNGTTVLDKVNLSLYEGENLVVMGKSGIGKSVLIKCIVRLIEADEGVISIFGENILECEPYKVKEIRLKIGFLFQGSALYDSLTVRENLEFPLIHAVKMRNKKKIRELVDEALENVSLPEAINKMPSELSGGMKKRIGLARTLILKPRIILYDEPTTGLDPITAREISELILHVQKKYKASSLVITHDMNCARDTGNRITILHNTKFIAEGSFEDLRNSELHDIKDFFK
jgi:phospholipid/cholesterol/gamma-HCH transport system ATP-binding protein